MRRARLPRQKFNSPREFLKRHSHVMGARRGRSLSLPLSLSLSESRARDTETDRRAFRTYYILCIFCYYILYIVHTTFNAYMCWEQESSSTHTRAREHKNTCIYIIYERVSVCFDVVKRHIIQAAIVPFMER